MKAGCLGVKKLFVGWVVTATHEIEPRICDALFHLSEGADHEIKTSHFAQRAEIQDGVLRRINTRRHGRGRGPKSGGIKAHWHRRHPREWNSFTSDITAHLLALHKHMI